MRLRTIGKLDRMAGSGVGQRDADTLLSTRQRLLPLGGAWMATAILLFLGSHGVQGILFFPLALAGFVSFWVTGTVAEPGGLVLLLSFLFGWAMYAGISIEVFRSRCRERYFTRFMGLCILLILNLLAITS